MAVEMSGPRFVDDPGQIANYLSFSPMTPHSETASPSGRRWRQALSGVAVLVLLVTLFYAEENARGLRAWKNCKQALAAKGVQLDWTNFIPAEVPPASNFFAAPKMQKWFSGQGATELSKRLSYPGYDESNRTARLTLAKITIGLPGTNPSSQGNQTVLKWEDFEAPAKASRLITNALGPMATDPAGFAHLLREPQEIQPAQIFLESKTVLSKEDVHRILPLVVGDPSPHADQIQVEPAGDNTYRLTMLAPDTVADFLDWNAQIEPDFDLIRQALQRPYARMGADYQNPFDIPRPNFVTMSPSQVYTQISCRPEFPGKYGRTSNWRRSKTNSRKSTCSPSSRMRL
jgi:hypothetical protein